VVTFTPRMESCTVVVKVIKRKRCRQGNNCYIQIVPPVLRRNYHQHHIPTFSTSNMQESSQKTRVRSRRRRKCQINIEHGTRNDGKGIRQSGLSLAGTIKLVTTLYIRISNVFSEGHTGFPHIFKNHFTYFFNTFSILN